MQQISIGNARARLKKNLPLLVVGSTYEASMWQLMNAGNKARGQQNWPEPPGYNPVALIAGLCIFGISRSPLKEFISIKRMRSKFPFAGNSAQNRIAALPKS
jgi:hypothetical protein